MSGKQYQLWMKELGRGGGTGEVMKTGTMKECLEYFEHLVLQPETYRN